MFKRLGAFALDILQVVVFAVAIFLFVYLLVLQPHKIKGSSMEPNYHDSQFLLTDKVSYRFNEPATGDIIVFKAPPDFKDEFIKRIIGVPGDKVTIRNNRIFINDKLLNETYIPSTFPTAAGAFAAEGKPVIVPTDSYFVAGDNRPHSFDSRAWGFVRKDKITGRAWFVYWPPGDAGTIKKPQY